MKAVKKRIWLVLLSVLAIAAMTAVLWPRPALPPQIITMPDGKTWQFVGTTYGTNHIVGSTGARFVNGLPPLLAKAMHKVFGTNLGQIHTQLTRQPSLCVWFRPVATNSPMLTSVIPPIIAKLADERGVEAGTQAFVAWFYYNGVAPLTVFEVMPRRSRELQIRFYQPDGQEALREIGRVHFANPLYGRYRQWRPESVPAAKQVGNVEIRLEGLLTLGQANSYPTPGAPEKGEEGQTVFQVSFLPPGGSADGWVMHGAELSDATGNHLRTSAKSFFYWDRTHGDRNSQLIEGTLWPDEATWRLKLELKQNRDATLPEQVIFRKVPIPRRGTTNAPVTSNTPSGVQVVLNCMAPRPGIAGLPELHVSLEAPGRTDGVALDLVELVTDAGEKLGRGSSAGARVDVPLATAPSNASTMDITFVVQKTRTVEFLVKPPTAK